MKPLLRPQQLAALVISDCHASCSMFGATVALITGARGLER